MTHDAERQAQAAFIDIPFRAIIEQSIVGIYVLQDECFCYANATFAAMFGVQPQDMIGGHLREFVPAVFLPEVLDRYHRRLDNDPPSMRFITQGKHRDGHTVLIEVHGSRTMYRERPAVVGVGIEATERLHNEAELQRSRKRLRDLSEQTMRRLERQRLRIARDLHDEIGGMLTALKMDAARVLRRVDEPALRELTRGLIVLTQQAIEVVRRISEELRPSALEHLDLRVAVARDLDQFTRRSGVAHRMVGIGPDPARLPPKRAHAIYRVFQEALTNIARHAGAGLVEVSFAVHGERLEVAIRDDGCGFDPAAPGGDALGLLGMAERARAIGADWRVESAAGAGSRVVLSAPLL
ncbi:MAG: PAS domain-containing sensor histidine kinase [Burkholderiales bacterium]|nr:PAS domain-containing sensor histidine kinase [Burkholderiales bacterium]